MTGSGGGPAGSLSRATSNEDGAHPAGHQPGIPWIALAVLAAWTLAGLLLANLVCPAARASLGSVIAVLTS